MYSEQEGGATPLSYFLKRGHKRNKNCSEKLENWKGGRSQTRPDKTI
jgi:hypothetical protein